MIGECTSENLFTFCLDFPQEMQETQERIGLLKADSDTRFNLESEYRIKELDLIRKDIHKLLDRLSGMDDEAIIEKRKHGHLETQIMTLQQTLSQVWHIRQQLGLSQTSKINPLEGRKVFLGPRLLSYR